MTPIELAKGMMERFDKKFSTNRNAHIGAPENENWPHIITKSASRDLKSFLTSEITAILTSIEEQMEKGKKKYKYDKEGFCDICGNYEKAYDETHYCDAFNESKSEDIELIRSIKEVIK